MSHEHLFIVGPWYVIPLNKLGRRHFTEAARAAAVEARRRKREEALPLTTPEVFAVRPPGACLRFGWEIRRFGGVVLDRSEVGHPSPGLARSAGLAVLSARGLGT